MEYTNADVFVYQILDCLVSEYEYKIVNIPRAKKDIWLANPDNKKYPIIRLNAQVSASAIFENDYLKRVQIGLASVLGKKYDVFIVNTNEESSPFHEGQFFQIVLNDEQISHDSIYTTFPKLKQAIRIVEDKQAECTRLTKHLESVQKEKMKLQTKFSIKKLPVISTTIFAIIALAYIVSIFLVMRHSSTFAAGLVAAGAYYKTMIVEMHEYWRFITMSFIHSDILTVLFFGFALIQIGNLCERVYKPIAYIFIFISSLLIGNLFPFIFNGNEIFFGIGSGVFGLLGALILVVFKNKLYMNRFVATQLSNVYLLMFICFLMEGISATSLFGGFIWGILMAFIVYPDDSLKPYRLHFVFSSIILLAGLVYGMSNIQSALPTHEQLDEEIVKQYETLGLKGYAQQIEKQLSLKGE